MKKIMTIITILLLIFVLTACRDFTIKFSGEVYAPSITEDEADFIGMVKELKKSTVAVLNSTTTTPRYGSGIIVDHPDETDDLIYYVITTQFNVAGTDSVTVYLSPTETLMGEVIGRENFYEIDEDIVLVKITSIMPLDPLELIPITDLEAINFKSIFSIGTTIGLAYFNYLTNPAQIMGIQDNIIVHGTNLNVGQIGSPLFLKESGQLVGINIAISDVINERPEVMINKALSINEVITIVDGLWSSL